MSSHSQAVFFYGITFEKEDVEKFHEAVDSLEYDYECEVMTLGDCAYNGNPMAVYIEDLCYKVEVNNKHPFEAVEIGDLKPLGADKKFKKFCTLYDLTYKKPQWHLAITSY